MKTLEEICLAHPLKVKIAKVVFVSTSDYDHTYGRRDAKINLVYPLEQAVKMWKHPLEFIERREEVHRYTNYEMLKEDARKIAAESSDKIKRLIPNVEEIIYGGLEKEMSKEIERTGTSKYVRTEIEHQTTRVSQVYIPGYNAEYRGKSFDVEPEALWYNPNL